MKKQTLILSILLLFCCNVLKAKTIRVLVVTGGHAYKSEQFNNMFDSLDNKITYQVVEFPAAFDMFLPENRSKYDVLVFYHMWQTITEEQAKNISDCIKGGKALVVLHHSICAFDNWPEYFNIIGGKYFHKPTTVNGKEYAVCKYKGNLHFTVKVINAKHPVTKGLQDYEVQDEAYIGYYIEPGVTALLTTEEPNSNSIIGWTKKYGDAQVVTLQNGHGIETYANPAYRKLLAQAIKWTYKKSK
jgi:type 1 glutamine amidotransferase